MNKTDPIRKLLRRRFRGLWLSADFRKLWASLTITSFGAQITNLALPLTAALLLNAKTALGETSAALFAPGIAGALIQMLTAPFAIVVDAVTFFVSALLLRRVEARNDVPHPGVRAGVWREIGEGLKLVARNRTLLALAWLAGAWQFLHHMQIAVLILFATRELSLSAGAIGFAYALGGLGCVLASALAQRLSARFGVGPMLVNGLLMTAIGWQAFWLIRG